jgi:hypothetical protein
VVGSEPTRIASKGTFKDIKRIEKNHG